MDLRPGLRRYGDLIIAVVLATVFAAEVALLATANRALAVPLAAGAGLALALRRQFPLLAFVVAIAGTLSAAFLAPGFDNNSAGILAVFVLALYSLGRHTEGLEAGLGGLLVLATTIVFLIGDGAPYWVPGDLLFALGFVGGPWAAGVAIRLRRERERALSARNAELQREQDERARRAVAAERARIARELHDVVSHAIAVTVLQARGGRRMIGTDEAQVRRAFDAIEHTNTQALGDMRRLLSLLRDTEDGAQTAPQPSLSRLESLVDAMREAGLSVQLSVSGSAEQVPPGVDLSAYRIVQEALTNVLKHAGPAAQARVEVTCGDDAVDLVICDSGGPSSNGSGPGQGLVGIRERVAVAGGRVEAGPAEAGGYQVRAELPYAVGA